MEFKGAIYHITVRSNGKEDFVKAVENELLEERLADRAPAWSGGLATESNVDLSDGSCVKLAKAKPPQAPAAGYVGSGTYLSPPYDWTVPASLNDLTVAADLNGGRVEATIETSSDGFKTVAAQTHVTVDDGVSTTPWGPCKEQPRGFACESISPLHRARPRRPWWMGFASQARRQSNETTSPLKPDTRCAFVVGAEWTRGRCSSLLRSSWTVIVARNVVRRRKNLTFHFAGFKIRGRTLAANQRACNEELEMKTQTTHQMRNAGIVSASGGTERHTDGYKRGRLPRFLSFMFSSLFLSNSTPNAQHPTTNTQLSTSNLDVGSWALVVGRSVLSRSLFTLLTLFLLAAFAPRAEAVSASATGGTVTEYRQSGKQWRAFVFTNCPVNEIPTMTANNAPSGVASASQEQSAEFPAWKAMDKNGGTRWSASGAMPQWLQYQFASGKVINGYEFSAFAATQTPSNFTLQASNDGSTWTILDTQTGKSAMTQYYTISHTVEYTYYRLNVTAVGGGGANTVSLTEFILYSTPALAVTDGGDVECLVVAAGGAGGSSYDTGGGGAGGMVTGALTLATGTYPVFVGWDSGRDSIFSTLRAIGGGYGAMASPGQGAAGGSGGGSVRMSSGGPPGYPGGAGTFGQGNKGGDGYSFSFWTGGGGGGAGGPGVDANGVDMISAGGPGLTNSISGSPVTYAAGGKGYNRSANDPSGRGKAGDPNTGNGGNGGYNQSAGGAGGSGIVIIRYVVPKGTVILFR